MVTGVGGTMSKAPDRAARCRWAFKKLLKKSDVDGARKLLKMLEEVDWRYSNVKQRLELRRRGHRRRNRPKIIAFLVI